jgi:hypothetical protein
MSIYWSLLFGRNCTRHNLIFSIEYNLCDPAIKNILLQDFLIASTSDH